MFIVGQGNFEYVKCTTKFDKNYNLTSITHVLNFNGNEFSISIC